ncbi:MAG: S-layer family protein, partial [Oscillatoria sp. SIO1A7]|nr:S-layer family protein [Oscillatoria sp. SIO1A7]
LQFGADPGAIVNRSIANPSPNPLLAGRPMGLQVESGRTLALVGGEVGLEGGNITPEGGRVELGSVGGNSLVGLNPTNDGFALDYAGVENFQDVRFSLGATVDVTDFDPLAGSGDVRVQGRQIIVSGGSQIASFTTGPVSSGSIELRARESVEIFGTANIQGFIFPSNLITNTFGDGDAGDISITTKRLSVRGGAAIFTNSLSPMQDVQGRAGNLRIMASELVELRGTEPSFGQSRLSVETLTNGAGGDLQITTRRLVIEDGAEVTAATSLSAPGRGGTVEIVASESVELRGTGIFQGEVVPSSLTASSSGAGDAGNLTVTTNTLTVSDGAEIGVSGTSTGAAGNLEIQASRASLDNNGRLRSETAAGDRGSIELNVGDIFLRRNSSISTEATGTASGGNITIDTTTLAALENSDITANAILGSGGNIFIRTRGLFLSPESEITASSQFGVSGTVEIVNPETDPASGLLKLPENVEDLTAQIGAICAATKEESSFIVTGRGGIPEDPTSTLRGRVIWRDLQDFSEEDVSPETLQSSSGQGRSLLASSPQEAIAPQLARSSAPQLIEATGWRQAADGSIELVASRPELSGGPMHRSAQCSDLLDRPSNPPPQVQRSDRLPTEQLTYKQ